MWINFIEFKKVEFIQRLLFTSGRRACLLGKTCKFYSSNLYLQLYYFLLELFLFYTLAIGEWRGVIFNVTT